MQVEPSPVRKIAVHLNGALDPGRRQRKYIGIDAEFVSSPGYLINYLLNAPFCVGEGCFI